MKKIGFRLDKVTEVKYKKYLTALIFRENVEFAYLLNEFIGDQKWVYFE